MTDVIDTTDLTDDVEGGADLRLTVGQVLDRLDASRNELGQLDKHLLRWAAGELNLSERQVRRRLDHYLANGDASDEFTLSDEHLHVIAAFKGALRPAWEELVKAGETMPSYSTFWRAFRLRLDTDIAGYIEDGADGMKRNSLYRLWEAGERNEVWEIDHKMLPIDVIADGCDTTLVKPWMTAIIDSCTRRELSWAITADVDRRPDADVVCALLAEAMMEHDIDGVTVGGIPGTVRSDQAAEFLGDTYTSFAATIGFDAKAVLPRSGHLKGKVERFFLTVDREFSCLQPGFTKGQVTHSGRNPARELAPMTADELRRRFAAWVTSYNLERAHSGLGNITPAAAWAADPTPLRWASPAVLRRSLLLSTKKPPKAQKKGVSFNGSWWVCPELQGQIGRRFTVRFPLYHTGFVELYDTAGEWVGTARQRMTDAEFDKLKQHRWGSERFARGVLAEATNARQRASRTVEDDPTAPLPKIAAALDDPLAGDLDALEALAARLDGDTP